MYFKIFKQFKTISISLSPNVQKDDVVLAMKLLFQPWKWRKGSATRNFENSFAKYLGVKYAFSFNSGRSAFYAILKALNLLKGSDVAIQAFTCNAVPNPVLWANLNPVYVDCANDFNMNTGDIDRLIRENKPMVAVVQHTFGLPSNINILISAMNSNTITTPLQTGVCKGVVIEDCAHALGAEYKGQKVGTFGKAGFFSFSRDKVISCVYGGMAVTNDDELAGKLEKLQKEFGQPNLIWIKQQILHPILLYFFILPLYNFIGIGKVTLVVAQWLHILSKAVNWKEKRGLKPDYFPKALPNALAIMAQHQFNKLEAFNAHRKQIAEFYYQELAGSKFILPVRANNIFLRFAVQHPKATEILYEAWHTEKILLGDWYTTVIAPDDTNMKEMRYEAGSCPNAEWLAKRALNLPTHINISMDDAKRIVNFLKKWE
jgi:perosamine synthetase